MWIKHTAAADDDSPVATTALIHEVYTNGQRVAFNEDGKARVPAEVGEQLCEYYADIVPIEDAEEDE